MASENEKIIRHAYQVAEEKDLEGFVNCFTPDGTFTDESIGQTYKGQEIAFTVQNYATAFPDPGTVAPLFVGWRFAKGHQSKSATACPSAAAWLPTARPPVSLTRSGGTA